MSDFLVFFVRYYAEQGGARDYLFVRSSLEVAKEAAEEHLASLDASEAGGEYQIVGRQKLWTATVERDIWPARYCPLKWESEPLMETVIGPPFKEKGNEP